MSSGAYAKGSKAWGICRRCGLRDLLNNLVFDEYYPGLRVHPECKDYKHPQEKLVDVRDPIALWKPSPEDDVNTPPVLSGVQNEGGIGLSWTPAEFFTGRVENYKVYKSIGGADFTLLSTFVVTYTYDGEIESETLSTEDPSVSPGVLVDYYVVAYDFYNNALPSNIVQITATLNPPTVAVLSGTNAGTTNSLSWTGASAGSFPIAGYRLYNADTSALIVDQATTSYDHTGLSGGTYNYYVVTYDTQGNVSSHSNTKTLTVTSNYAIVGMDFADVTTFYSMNGTTFSQPSFAGDLGMKFFSNLNKFIAYGSRDGGVNSSVHLQVFDSSGLTNYAIIPTTNMCTDDIVYNATLGQFVIAARRSSSTQRIWKSTDFSSFTLSYSDASEISSLGVLGNGRTMAFYKTYSGSAKYSDDLTSWSTSTLGGLNKACGQPVWASGHTIPVLVVPASDAAGSIYILTTTNGTTWTTYNLGNVGFSDGAGFHCWANHNNGITVVCFDANSVWYSTNGTTWTQADTSALPASGMFLRPDWSSVLNKFILATNDVVLGISTDGSVWTTESTSIFQASAVCAR